MERKIAQATGSFANALASLQDCAAQGGTGQEITLEHKRRMICKRELLQSQ
jgi:hypothetical protein